MQLSLPPASSGSCAEIRPFSLRGTVDRISTSPLQGLTPAVARRKDGLFPLLHAGAPPRAADETLNMMQLHWTSSSSSLRPSLQVVLHTKRAALLHQKLRATVTRVLAQFDRRVHPSDSASNTTTRHLGYFSNHLPALEKATSSCHRSCRSVAHKRPSQHDPTTYN